MKLLLGIAIVLAAIAEVQCTGPTFISGFARGFWQCLTADTFSFWFVALGCALTAWGLWEEIEGRKE